MSDTPQAELVKELGLDPTKMTAVRMKHLASTDWWKDSENHGRIMLTDEGVFKIRLWHEAHKEEPQLLPEFMTCQVIELLPNPEWLCIRVDHGEKGFLREKMQIPKKLRGTFYRGKTVRVEVVRGSTGVIYRHESQGTGYTSA